MSANEPESPSRELPEQRVGTAMRDAREAAGISLRDMARRLGYHSHTTLSSYERGAVMPTDEVVTGYEQVLGLTLATLTAVLEQARIERHGDAWAKRRVHLPVEFAQTEREPSNSPQRRVRHGWVRKPWIFVVGGMLILGLLTLTFVLLADQPKSSPVPASTMIGVRDGSDPKVTGCATGAVTADNVDVYDPPEHLVGILQLRNSLRCGTSWGRFVPTAGLAAVPPLELEIDVDRPADGAVAKFSVAYDRLPAYGNMLISLHECVYAQLTLTRQGKPSLPPVQTACRQS